jgi:hypothetical protein
MRKNNKVYSTSDFVNASSSIVVADTWWQIDSIEATAVGEFSKTPLFELQLKQFKASSSLEVPEGYEDASADLRRNRTYFIREGRPMYNELAEIWEAIEDNDVFRVTIRQKYEKKLLAGHVERLTGVSYSRLSRGGSMITSSKLEVWYPEDFEEGVIMDDFLYLCNRGVYTPIVEEKKEDELIDLTKVDPKLIATIKAMMNK